MSNSFVKLEKKFRLLISGGEDSTEKVDRLFEILEYIVVEKPGRVLEMNEEVHQIAIRF